MSMYETGIRPAIDQYLLKLAEEKRQKEILEAVNKKYPNFNGTEAEYKKLHKWVRKTFPTPAECDHCKTQEAKRYDWASIDNSYTQNREDWEYLCRSCHIKSDGRINQLKKGLEGAEPWNLGKKMSDEVKAKMKANHWSTRQKWQPRERDEHGRFI